MRSLLRLALVGGLMALVAVGTVASQPRKQRDVANYFIGTERGAGPEELTGPPAPEAFPTPIDDGLAWLQANQNVDGSWGSIFELIVTSTTLETLETLDRCMGVSLDDGAVWLAGEMASNHDFLARQAAALAAAPGFEAVAAGLVAQLLSLRNPVEPNLALPNWPEGGWGLGPGFATDSLTTALSLLALDRAGFNGGFTRTNEPLAAAGTNVHQWEIPADAVKVRIQITVSGSEVRLRMTQGAPPTIFDPFFSLPPGPNFLITLPDSLPFTPGTNFISVESPSPPALAASYTMTASYETPTFDTRMLAEPLDYLRESQNVDGGWGLQRGQDTDFYTTLHVLLALLRYSQYDLATEIGDGIAHVKTEQLVDGSFGLGGPGIPYMTALAALSLVRSETSPFSTETEDAVSALSATQDVDGSWDQEAYDSALAMLALWDHDLPPTANAGPDQTVTDSGADCSEGVTLAGSGSSPDGAIVSYEWTENCVVIATGPTPTLSFPAGNHNLLLTVTADDGQTDQDPVVVSVVGTDLDGDGFASCTEDCDDGSNQVWAPPGEVLNLVVSAAAVYSWTPPTDLGGTAVVYDVLRSSDPSDFDAGAVCVESDDGADSMVADPAVPALGTAYYYLVRAENACPLGEGPLGGITAPPRFGRACP